MGCWPRSERSKPSCTALKSRRSRGWRSSSKPRYPRASSAVPHPPRAPLAKPLPPPPPRPPPRWQSARRPSEPGWRRSSARPRTQEQGPPRRRRTRRRQWRRRSWPRSGTQIQARSQAKSQAQNQARSQVRSETRSKACGARPTLVPVSPTWGRPRGSSNLSTRIRPRRSRLRRGQEGPENPFRRSQHRTLIRRTLTSWRPPRAQPWPRISCRADRRRRCPRPGCARPGTAPARKEWRRRRRRG
mmetsp:Transcript_25160/g.56589  ORF Transcript_25160/g.56589 Transcript_25160/m.56589 type:complete len:244 (-) Transcript_25160:497-1228(-)